MDSPPSASAQTPKPEPQKDSPQPKTGMLNILGEVSQYTVLGAFILYILGFLIWHSHLGSFGLSSIQFLQVEYLSGAFCYLFLVCTFALPPAIIVERWISNSQNPPKGDSFIVTLLIWFVLTSRVTDVFFQNHYVLGPLGTWFWIGASTTGFGILYSILYVILAVRWRESKFFKRISNRRVLDSVIVGVLGILFVESLMINKALDKVFLISTLMLYFIAVYIGGSHIKERWHQSQFSTKILMVMIVTLVLIANVQLFGVRQFRAIPKSAGGGKPELAYLKFSSQYPEIATSLGLPATTNEPALNGFYGPVSILLKTDKDIVFVNFAEKLAGETEILNDLQVLTTNSISSNSIVKSESAYPLSVVGYTNHPPSAVKLTAKQVRSELIDVIIYAK